MTFVLKGCQNIASLDSDTDYTHNMQEQLLASVFGLSTKLGRVPFSTVVKRSTGFDVIPINLQNFSDRMLINTLNKIFKEFLKTCISTRSRYQGDRINEVGKRIEDALVHEMDKQPLTVKRLPKSGYPDIEISHADHITYLEMKTSAVKEKSGFRYFYYTNVNKIKANARHLLLNVSVTQETPRYWKIDNLALTPFKIKSQYLLELYLFHLMEP
jgi:hypothetical protein